ncbi:hypothetical protein ACE10Z_23440 [Bradyrhizobium sp. Pha-3]|uniref:hypothetical protein n=1 Tax=Bradyrhizobium sp. Pha-3 TaxID=208375 RepID=UPI0035D4C8E1
MGESNARRPLPSRENNRTPVPGRADRRPLGTLVPSVRAAPICFGKSKIGIVAHALWPVDTTAHLAQALGCTKRHAGLLIDGKRKLNAVAAWAMLGELVN